MTEEKEIIKVEITESERERLREFFLRYFKVKELSSIYQKDFSDNTPDGTLKSSTKTVGK